MKELLFNDRGYDVLTSSWTACAKPGKNVVQVSYLWGSDGISVFSSATGVSRVKFKMSMEEFKLRLSMPCVVADLRKFQ